MEISDDSVEVKITEIVKIFDKQLINFLLKLGHSVPLKWLFLIQTAVRGLRP